MSNLIERPPVIVVMGHIDHGKSTLLDFIRHSNVVAGEAGSITQHMSAYEVVRKDTKGVEKKITFIDTPGHAAFSAMRLRGANVADIAILIISAEDGVKPQTLEAYKSIQEAKIPFVVAINKIDKPNANPERVKNELVENGIYLEGWGGNIPFVPISAKSGEGVQELLDMVLLMAELEEYKGDSGLQAEGFVLESKMEAHTGVETVVIIKNGTLKKGDFLVVNNKANTVRRLEDFLGNPIDEATFSSPVKIIGCCDVPNSGQIFKTYKTKKEAENNLEADEVFAQKNIKLNQEVSDDATEILIIVKADVFGSIEAIQQEIAKIQNERAKLRIVSASVGDISENDIKLAGHKDNTLIVGFNVKINNRIKNLADQNKVRIENFDVIYKLTEWLEENIISLIPKIKVEESTGKAKIIRVFNKAKDEQIIGGKVKEGKIVLGSTVKIIRRDCEIGKGTITTLQSQKLATKEVHEGDEFGMGLKSKNDIAEGDYLEAFQIVEK
ncbi:MAG: translation initiation factor IF-2 [Patescibacteria group bacterium]